MKCYVHQDEDAVAVCKVCGKGACNDCVIILSGDSYCKTCLEAGRVKTLGAQARLLLPTGTPSKTHFLIGGVGAIISGVAALLHMVLGGIIGRSLFFGFVAGSYNSLMFVTGVPLAVGIILAGIGYLGVRRNYGRGIGTAGFALSLVSASSLLSLLAVSSIFYRSSFSSPFNPIFFTFGTINSVLFGTTQILWGAAHIVTREFTGNPSFSFAIAIILVLSGSLTASVLVSIAGIALFLVAEIMVFILFLTSSLPVVSTQD